MRKPNAFIVGAPKAGTTAMTQYLGRHPDIFIPSRKELHFFGSDLHKRGSYPDTLEAYLEFYAGARDEAILLDASVCYLQSALAAAEIHAFDPEARIIIMLREPVEMMYALHSQLLYSGSETVADFQAALALEGARKEGRDIPGETRIRENLYYRETARYTAGVKRYLDTFGAAQVHVILYDDFMRDPAACYGATLEFLGLAPFAGATFERINPNKRTRSHALRRVIEVLDDDRPLGRLVLPAALRWRLKRWNRVWTERTPMDPDLRRALTREFEGEVAALGELLGRDLSAWSRTPDRP
jgi:hypothetical protein